MSEKVMMFIDGANLFHGCKNYKSGYQIDLLKLRDVLLDGRDLIRVYYYGSLPTDDKNAIENQKRFFNFLEYNGFKVPVIPLRKREVKFTCEKCGAENIIEKNAEKGVDTALATDLISFGIMRYYDTGIIVSGDLDYFKAIEEVQRKGVKIEIAYFRKSGITPELIRQADKFINLEEISERISKK